MMNLDFTYNFKKIDKLLLVNFEISFLKHER